jgi:hypothetical protein
VTPAQVEALAEDAQTSAFDAHRFEHRASRVNGRERLTEDSARGISEVSRVVQVVRLASEFGACAATSVGVDEGAQLSEASLAYAAHEHDVLRPSEWAVALALLDYARG